MQGPWKWIEGAPADGTRPGLRRARADERQPQFYHLPTDPAEIRDVSAEHPETVRQLSALPDRDRDGGYSRELPPVPPAVAGLASRFRATMGCLEIGWTDDPASGELIFPFRFGHNQNVWYVLRSSKSMAEPVTFADIPRRLIRGGIHVR